MIKTDLQPPISSRSTIFSRGVVHSKVFSVLYPLISPQKRSQLQFRIVVADDGYYPANLAWLMAAITGRFESSLRQNQVFDCDDHVQLLRAISSLSAATCSPNPLLCPLAVGYLITEFHAFNWLINDLGNVVLIDTHNTQHRSVEIVGAIDPNQNPESYDTCLTFLNLREPTNAILSVYI